MMIRCIAAKYRSKIATQRLTAKSTSQKNKREPATCIDKCGIPDGDQHCTACCETNSCTDMWWSCKNCECRPGYDEKKQRTRCCSASESCILIGTHVDKHNFTQLDTLCCPANKRGKECDQCQIGRYGPNCEACKSCSGHGRCDGSGTSSGTGNCICDRGFLPPDCRLADPSVFHCPGTIRHYSVDHPPGARVNAAAPLRGCSAHGECLSKSLYSNKTRDSAYCDCDSHWKGAANCSKCTRQFTGGDCNLCAFGYFADEQQGCTMCPGTLLADDGHVVHVCSGRGDCQNKTGHGVDAGTCTCDAWWMRGDRCETVLFHTFAVAIPISGVTLVVIASAISLWVAWRNKDSVWCNRRPGEDREADDSIGQLRNPAVSSASSYKDRWSKNTRPTPWGKGDDSSDPGSAEDYFVEPLAGHRRTQSGQSQKEYQHFSRLARNSISSEYSLLSRQSDDDPWSTPSPDLSDDDETNAPITREEKTNAPITRGAKSSSVHSVGKWTANSSVFVSDADDDDSDNSTSDESRG